MTTLLLSEERRVVAAVALLGATAGAALLVHPLAPLALIGGALLLAIGLYKPDVMVPLIFVCVLLDQVGRFDFSLGPIPMTLAKLSVMATMGVWLVHAVAHRRPLVRATPFSAGFAAMLVTMVVSLAAARHLQMEDAVVTVVSIALLATLVHVVDAIGTAESLHGLIRLLATAMVGVMLYALLSGQRIEDIYFDGRQSGLMGDPNEWCALLLVTCPFFMGGLAHDRHPASLPLLGLLTFLFPLMVFQSLSRAGFLTLLALSPVLVYLVWPRRRLVWIGLAAALLYVPMAVDLELLAERYGSLVDEQAASTDGSLTVRSVLARTAIALFLAHPILGVGLGMFPYESTLYTSGDAYMKVAHNTYLTIAAEQGLLGIASHAFVAGCVALYCWRLVRRASDPPSRRLAVGLSVSLAGVAAIAFTLNLITFSPAYLVLGLGLVVGRAIDKGDPT